MELVLDASGLRAFAGLAGKSSFVLSNNVDSSVDPVSTRESLRELGELEGVKLEGVKLEGVLGRCVITTASDSRVADGGLNNGSLALKTGAGDCSVNSCEIAGDAAATVKLPFWPLRSKAE